MSDKTKRQPPNDLDEEDLDAVQGGFIDPNNTSAIKKQPSGPAGPQRESGLETGKTVIPGDAS